jgi:2'-5' RNA ligase
MGFIKKYYDFLLEKMSYDGSCLMVKLDITNWNNIIYDIKDEDIYQEQEGDIYGRQKNPHLTLLFPIVDKNPNLSFKVLDKVLIRPINIKVNKIDFFESEKYDVLKFSVITNTYLDNIHSELKENIENGDKFDVYRPHITIAYLKKGSAKKYCRDINLELKNQTNIVFTNNGSEIKYKWKL